LGNHISAEHGLSQNLVITLSRQQPVDMLSNEFVAPARMLFQTLSIGKLNFASMRANEASSLKLRRNRRYRTPLNTKHLRQEFLGEWDDVAVNRVARFQ
jgi:hypothetical protein